MYGPEAVGYTPPADAGMDVSQFGSGPSAPARFVNSLSHMADQIHSVESQVGALEKRGVLPAGSSDRFRSIALRLAEAERNQFAAREHQMVRDYMTRWERAPQEWVDALQAKAAGHAHVEEPAGEHNGHTFAEFEEDTRDLYRWGAGLHNIGTKVAGKESVSPELIPMHPSRRKETGAQIPILGGMFSNTIDAARNTPDAIRGVSKGFNSWVPGAFERLKAGFNDAILGEARIKDGQYVLPKSWRYLRIFNDAERAEKKQALPKIKGRTKDGDFIIGDKQDFDRFLSEEPNRAALWMMEAQQAKNAAGHEDAKISRAPDFGRERELPYLPGVHEARPSDFADFARHMAETGGAMSGHGAALEHDLEVFANEVRNLQGKASGSDRRALGALSRALGQGGDVPITSLRYRAYQQEGRANSSKGFFSNIESAWSKASNDAALATNPSATNVQVPQVMGQMGLMNDLDVAAMGTLRMLSSYPRNALAIVTRNKSNLVPIDPVNEVSPSITKIFAKGSSVAKDAIEHIFPYTAAKILKNPSADRFLRRHYTDSQIADLRGAIKGRTLDLSDPYINHLANSLRVRVMETVNGSGLATSSPAAYGNTAVRLLGKFKTTTSTISKASASLFRKGGMMDQGSAVKNALAHAKFANVIAGWIASNKVRASAYASLVASLGTGSAINIMAQAIKARNDDGTDRSLTPTQRMYKATNEAALNDVASLDPLKMAKGGAVLSSSALQSPLFDPRSISQYLVLSDADRKNIGINLYNSGVGGWDAFLPSPAAALMPYARAIIDAYGSGDDPADATTFRPDGRFGRILSGNSQIPLIRGLSPLKEGWSAKVRAVPGESDREINTSVYGKEKKSSLKVGR